MPRDSSKRSLTMAREGEIGILTVQRAFSLNSEGKTALTEAIVELSNSDSARALILNASEPRAFLVDVRYAGFQRAAIQCGRTQTGSSNRTGVVPGHRGGRRAGARRRLRTGACMRPGGSRRGCNVWANRSSGWSYARLWRHMEISPKDRLSTSTGDALHRHRDRGSHCPFVRFDPRSHRER